MAKKGKLSRRSFLGRVAGGVALTGAGAAFAGAAIQSYSGRSDADAGNTADTAGYGRTGRTDSDPNDSANYGAARTGLTDNDSGPCGDEANYGRGETGMTDNDQGSCSDPVGRGRGPN